MAKALSRKRLGGTCNLNICGGGETLLSPEIAGIAEAFLGEGHLVSLVTNGTISKRINDVCDFPARLRKRLFVKFSLQYLELVRTKLLDVFFDNVQKCKSAGIAFTIELTANDRSVPHIPEIMEICTDRTGAHCHIIESRDIRPESIDRIPRLTGLPVAEHIAAWSVFDSPLFDFQQTIWGESMRGKFCYGGDWALDLSLEDGHVQQCSTNGLTTAGNLFENIDEPFRPLAVGKQCPWPHCYFGYVWQGLGSAVPDIKAPYYAEMRNRRCTDGTEWLTPTVKKLFGSKPCESHKAYSLRKQELTNSLMAVEYQGVMPEDDAQPQLAHIVWSVMAAKGYFNTVVYGLSQIVEWLGSLLKHTAINAEYYISNRGVDVFRRLIGTNAEMFAGADAIVIADHRDFARIKNEIKAFLELPVVSVADIINDVDRKPRLRNLFRRVEIADGGAEYPETAVSVTALNISNPNAEGSEIAVSKIIVDGKLYRPD
jgi:hypothetical protein